MGQADGRTPRTSARAPAQPSVQRPTQPPGPTDARTGPAQREQQQHRPHLHSGPETDRQTDSPPTSATVLVRPARSRPARRRPARRQSGRSWPAEPRDGDHGEHRRHHVEPCHRHRSKGTDPDQPEPGRGHRTAGKYGGDRGVRRENQQEEPDVVGKSGRGLQHGWDDQHDGGSRGILPTVVADRQAPTVEQATAPLVVEPDVAQHTMLGTQDLRGDGQHNQRYSGDQPKRPDPPACPRLEPLANAVHPASAAVHKPAPHTPTRPSPCRPCGADVNRPHDQDGSGPPPCNGFGVARGPLASG